MHFIALIFTFGLMRQIHRERRCVGFVVGVSYDAFSIVSFAEHFKYIHV